MIHRAGLRRTVGAALTLAGLVTWGALAPGCTSATVRRPDVAPPDYPAGVVELRWRTLINDRNRFSLRPEECASGVVVGDRLIIGSRAGRVQALATDDGRVVWSVPVSGAVDSEPLHAPALGLVFFGSDDGTIYALDPASGSVRWTYKSKGSIERSPALNGETLFVATAADRLVALDARTGKARWQYDREPPEGFTIHGYAGPRLHDGLVLTGFSDGTLVALQADSGTVAWTRSLAGASEQYVDVDSTPLVVKDAVVASSYSGGLYAVTAGGTEVRWRLGIEGAGTVREAGGTLYFAAPREGLTALTPDGHVLWRQALADAGDLTVPQAVGPFLFFSGTRAGLFVVNRASGALLQVFNPGRGMCAAPAFDARQENAYVLVNSGSVYALRITR